MDNKSRIVLKYTFAAAAIIAGLTLNATNIGETNFEFQGTVGNWLINIGFIMILAVTVRNIRKNKKIVDERMKFVADQASRIALFATYLLAFVVMLADGIQQIRMPYHVFMSYFICIILLVYAGSYQFLLRKN